MKDFDLIISSECRRHPSATPVDIIKLCYQATFGAEHLLADRDRARDYFFCEYDSTEARDGELYEDVSESYTRANIGVWKQKGLDPDALFDLFYRTACEPSGKDKKELFERFSAVAGLAKQGSLPFPVEEWESALKEYLAAGRGAVHHSDIYRSRELPSYRIIAKKYIKE